MSSTVFLVRSGETRWHAEGKLLGRRNIGLSEVGLRQAKGASTILGSLEIKDFMSSPLARAMDTAEIIARHHTLTPGRDRRLTDVDVGKGWEGKSLRSLEQEKDYQSLLHGEATAYPDGEDLEMARTRMVAAIQQAVSDNQSGANIVIVSHAGPIQLALTYFLEMPLGGYQRLMLNPGSVSVLTIDVDLGLSKIIGINWTSSVEVMVNVVTS